MASILDRYGIKEVADCSFYEIGADGSVGKPVLFLDTLKVSTVEQTASTADARGGKGNPKLITWDFGKEITVNIQDALFSPKSMAIMFGDGTVTHASSSTVLKTAIVRVKDNGALTDYMTADIYDSVTSGAVRKKVYLGSGSTPDGYAAFASAGISLKAVYAENGAIIDSTATISEMQGYTAAGALSSYAGQKVMVTYTEKIASNTITITADSFPGTYYVQGDTYARSDVTGKDQFFQFIIPKCKMTAENTITLEAEGDPSVFNMNLTVLRPEDGDMMKLVQYDLLGE